MGISQIARHLRNFLNLKNKLTSDIERNLGYFPDSQVFGEIPQIPRYLMNFPDAQVFGEFSRFAGIWGIPKILRVVYCKDFENFLNDWIFGEFLKPLGIWEISQIAGHLRNYLYLKNKLPSDSLRNLANSPDSLVSMDSQVVREFPRFPDIW